MNNVKKLILGHFSSRYKDLNIFKSEAKSVFNNIELAFEGKKIIIQFIIYNFVYMSKDLSNYRKKYSKGKLVENIIPKNPIDLFSNWFNDVEQNKSEHEPNIM